MATASFLSLSDRTAFAILDQLREGVIVTDSDGAIRFVNEAARTMHGMAETDVGPEAYASRYNLFTVEGEPYSSDELPLARAVRGETVVDATWMIRRPDGAEIYAVGNAKPLLDDAGQQVGAVLIIRDETRRFRAESELRASEETVRAFFETAGIYTAVIDLEGDDFTMVMGNARMAAAFGLERLAGQSGKALLGEERATRIQKGLRDALSSKDPTIVEYPWDQDGSERWFVATITAMRNSSNRLFLASLDITDRKLAEQSLAKALETKDVLLHEVNHRVKNSLQIITALLKLQERLGDETLASQLREARNRVETVARVHERLYDTSAHDRVDIVGYLEDLLTHVVASVGDSEAVGYEFEHRGERIELGVEYSVPLALILVEMAMNASKYAFPDGAEGTIRVETAIRDDRFVLTISDDGIGMDAAPKNAGTGLGMRIVNALATQIRADTSYLPSSKGTAFQLGMPLPAPDER